MRLAGWRGALSRGAWHHPRSLKARLVLIMTGVGLAGAIGVTLLLAVVITPSFDRLEERSIAAQVERTRAALGQEASRVRSAVHDYGDWTASYEYLAAPEPAFERESVSRAAIANLDIDAAAFVDPRGRVIVARWFDGGKAANPAMRERFAASIAQSDLRALVGMASSRAFYMRLGGGIAAVGVARVRQTDGSGVSRGYVVMARRLTSARLSGLLHRDAWVHVVPPVGRAVDRTPTRMIIAVPIEGADGRAIASARFPVSRDVSILGRRMLLLAVAGSTLLLTIVLIVLRRIISRLVLHPLGRMERHMQRIRASGSLRPIDEQRREDEIGSLERSFDTMLRQLMDLRERLEAQSFALGRSESAVGVIHNVRNALNPITTILSRAIAQPPAIDRATIDRAVAELAHAEIPEARRRKLAAFVAAAIEAGDGSRVEHLRELHLAREAMADALEIIDQQQAASHERPPLGAVDVTAIVARNATIAHFAEGVSIGISFPAGPQPVVANRLILSQVVGNLFANAAEAVAATGRTSGSIAVTIQDRGDGVIVRIRDDGEGFDREIGTRVFQRGFSTRDHRSGGLGLHWCANAMTAMDGQLRLESEGPGRGATAVLTLRRPVGMARAA